MNKESDWEECLETTSSVRVSPDPAKARSLIDTAKGRIIFLSENIIKESNANYLFEFYYSSALELLHALLLFDGYSVGNHICLGYYLRDILVKPELYRLFDDCRIKRNGLVYYGRKMDFETAKSGIDKCKKLVHETNLLLKEKNNS
ncbi:MAG: hypothetical protein V2A62_02595 [Candidatus Woesearchaeota archaeon]